VASLGLVGRGWRTVVRDESWNPVESRSSQGQPDPHRAPARHRRGDTTRGKPNRQQALTLLYTALSPPPLALTLVCQCPKFPVCMYVYIKIRRQHTRVHAHTGPRRHARAPACRRHHNPTACLQAGIPHRPP